MLTPEDIARFYSNVLHNEESCFTVSQRQIQTAIQNMVEAYKPYNTDWCRQESGIVANYNDQAHRCAYLHKYAPLHTCLVQDMFHQAFTECDALKFNLWSKFDGLNICSLGGGPGTDIIGIISACQEFGLVTCFAQVVDLMSGWKNTFNSIVEELRLGSYGNLSMNLNANYFHCSYITSDLLQAIDNKVLKSIRSADLITMVKFVSAATCRDTEDMVEDILCNMKPGAVVLFIDNASGGFSEIMTRSAQKCDLDIIFGPLNHFLYTKPAFNVTRYGYTSCYETRVTVQVWMKPDSKLYQPQSFSNPSQYSKSKVAKRSEETSIDMTSFSEEEDLSSSTEDPNALCAITSFIIIVLVLFVIMYLYYF